MFLWSMNKSISWKIQERSRNGKVIFIKMTVEIETYFNSGSDKEMCIAREFWLFRNFLPAGDGDRN